MQGFAVALIVIACTGYAVWALMPSAAQRRAASFALRATWPGFIDKRLRRWATTTASGTCGSCGSCAAPPHGTPKTAPKTAPKEQAIRIHRRPGR